MAAWWSTERVATARVVQDGLPVHLSSAVVAGLAATVVGSPADVVGTRIMVQTTQPALVSFCVQILKTEGVTAFYKGDCFLQQLLTPCLLTTAGQAMLIFVHLNDEGLPPRRLRPKFCEACIVQRHPLDLVRGTWRCWCAYAAVSHPIAADTDQSRM